MKAQKNLFHFLFVVAGFPSSEAVTAEAPEALLPMGGVIVLSKRWTLAKHLREDKMMDKASGSNLKNKKKPKSDKKKPAKAGLM